MTNYKPNIWYGWNGGECPVHPKTEVEFVLLGHNGIPWSDCVAAENLVWDRAVICAFRVTKEHREPREFWVVGGCEAWDDEDAAYASLARLGNKEIIHVREVLE